MKHSLIIKHNQLNLRVMSGQGTSHRLKHSCFRKVNKALAGNFLIEDWRYPLDVIEALQTQFITAVFEDLDEGTHSVTLTTDELIGWANIEKLERFNNSDDLEFFRPSKKSSGLRVKNNGRHDAPLTNEVTIVYKLKFKKGEPFVIVHSMHPGEDIGELSGDVSKRESIAFYGLDHPGEALVEA